MMMMYVSVVELWTRNGAGERMIDDEHFVALLHTVVFFGVSLMRVHAYSKYICPFIRCCCPLF